MRSVAPITKILPQFLWSAKMPKIYAKCQKSMQKTWNFIFCHLNLVRAVYYLSFKPLVRSVAPLTKILPPFLWFRGGLCYKHRKIRHGVPKLQWRLCTSSLVPLPSSTCSWWEEFATCTTSSTKMKTHSSTVSWRLRLRPLWKVTGSTWWDKILLNWSWTWHLIQ